MRKPMPRLAVAMAGLVVSTMALAGTPLRVQLPADAPAASGRLLVNIQPAADAEQAAREGKVTQVRISPWGGATGTLAGMEVPRLAPGQPLVVDADTHAWPAGLSQLPAGDYYVQAVLDTGRDNGYGDAGNDIASQPVKLRLGPGADLPVLVLDQRSQRSDDPWAIPAEGPPQLLERVRGALADARADIRRLDFVSPALSAFWGRPVHMLGWIVLPPGYSKGNARYPVVYSTHGFGGSSRSALGAVNAWADMRDGLTPPMIRVQLDQSTATGTHEFADSVNNGPWGTALVEELIPTLERDYRMDGRPSGRLLTGHSSGGWAALWLQVRYPEVFGGAWPTAPDASDFREFTNLDIYAPNANAYRRADGTATPLVRRGGKDVASFEQFTRLEDVTAPYGGQFASFDWVFSPRGPDGRPQPLFDRQTGVVDPQVAAYWREHYDIAHRIRTRGATLKPRLDGKVHLVVGTQDTFYLDRAARLLKQAFDGAGIRADFRFVPGRDHGDLFKLGENPMALSRTLAWEMYQVARPGAKMPDDLPRFEVEAP